MVVLQILLSLFVAVILDNLELDEDLKKLKQVSSGFPFRLLTCGSDFSQSSLRFIRLEILAVSLYLIESGITIIVHPNVYQTCSCLRRSDTGF